MKLTAVMILIALVPCSAKSYSQKITLQENNTPLKKVLEKIHKQSGFVFFYDTKDIRNKTVTVAVKDATLNHALDDCLRDQHLVYKIVSNTVLLEEQDPTGNKPVQENQAVQSIKISGSIVDEKGQPLAGVNIRVKDGSAAAVSASDGSFSINVPDNNAILIFTYVGYAPQEISAGSPGPLTIKMLPSSTAITGVVVVGYGTQRKVDLTGSVASVSGEVLNERVTPNAANLLSGTMPGLDAVQSTGQPGRDAPNLQIRGYGSFGAGAAPLILVDGIIVNDLNSIAGNDIESVSVLKDAASAAIYGNRAANGVILITTKRGKKGVTTITYNDNFSVNQATRLPDLVWNSVDYMTLYNQAREHSNQADIYTAAQIAAYQNAGNNPQYPNFNYIKHYIQNSFSQNHHISVNGGNDKTTFNLAANYLNQNGTVQGTSSDRYNLLFSLDSKVNRVFKAGATVSLSKQDITEPVLGNDNLILLIYQAAPTYAPFLPDGSGRISSSDYVGNGAGHNRSIQYVLNSGNTITNNYETRTQTYLQADITKDLSWLVKGAFNYDDQFQRTWQYPINEYAFHPDATGTYDVLDNGNPSSLGVGDFDTRQFYLNAYTTLNYKHTFDGNHHLAAMAGFSAESYTLQTLSGSKVSFPNNDLTQLDAGSVTGQSLNGDQEQYALESFFGQINYDYKGKYLLQLDGRDDATSRIAPSKRWGLFPAAAVGWKISEEDFMRSLDWVDFLKVRASYGRLGNQNIGYYPYQALLNVTQYAYNSSTGVSQGVNQQNLNNPDLQWEKTDNTDVGLDLSIDKGLLSLTADYYNKKTSGILFKPNVLEAIGLNAPVENAGSVQNRGFEFDLGHTNHLGRDFRYSVDLLFSLNRNKVLYLANGTQDDGMNINKVGLPYGSYYLVKWAGIYQSAQEIANSPKESFASPKPGDLKFQDANGDNKIDATDRRVVSGAFPSYTYSFRVNFGYKNWSLNTFWQGVQGVKHYVANWGIDPFMQGGAPPVYFEKGWTAQNPSRTIPAIYTNGYAPDDNSASTYFLQDASFLRLKNIRLSYQLPARQIKKLFLSDASIFISGDNLLTFTKFPGDPERLQTGPLSQSAPGAYGSTTRFAQYPQIRLFTTGLNISF